MGNTAVDERVTLESEAVARLDEVRGQLKMLRQEENTLKKQVYDYFSSLVDKDDARVPSETVEFNGKTYQTWWGRQDKSKLSPEKVEEYLKGRGLWEQFSKLTRVLDDEALNAGIEEGIISLDELQTNCMEPNIVRQVQVKVIE